MWKWCTQVYLMTFRKFDESRKTAVIDCELNRLNIDVAVLQETWLPDSRSLNEEHYTWQGRGVNECMEHGVRFSVRNTLLCMIEHLVGDTEIILTLCLPTFEGLVNLVCIYAPTLQTLPEVKDECYAHLDCNIMHIPSYEHLPSRRLQYEDGCWSTVLVKYVKSP